MGKPKEKSGELAVTGAATALQNGVDENAMVIGHELRGLAAQPVNLTDTEEVEQRSMDYFKDCVATGARVSPPGLALWLGISSKDLTSWLTEVGDDEHRRSAARIYQFLHASFADNALGGKTSPQLAMFFAKNWFGYTDAQRVETAETVEKSKSLDELQKIADALPDDFNIIETQNGKRGKK